MLQDIVTPVDIARATIQASNNPNNNTNHQTSFIHQEIKVNPHHRGHRLFTNFRGQVHGNFVNGRLFCIESGLSRTEKMVCTTCHQKEAALEVSPRPPKKQTLVRIALLHIVLFRVNRPLRDYSMLYQCRHTFFKKGPERNHLRFHGPIKTKSKAY